MLYTDFEKAFDRLPHKRLISKLLSYGCNDKITNWILSFLCFRKHSIKIHNALSDYKEVTSGIPQGSVLGPLLFIVYINDLPEYCINGGNLLLFADDSKQYEHIRDIKDCMRMQECCQNLYDWSERWLMKINIDKCKVMTVANSKSVIDYKYGFNDCQFNFMEIERVSTMKDLGVTFDTELFFKNHINEKINKAYQMLGIIRRNFIDIDRASFIMIYKSMVRSHLEYSNSVWSPYKLYLINDIEKVQKRATKLVKGCSKKL